jgi:IrrE N-terminal-like domain
MTTLGNSQSMRTPSGLKVAPMSYDKLEQVAEGIRPMLPIIKGHGRNPWTIDAWRVLEKTLTSAGFNYHCEEKEQLQECAAFTIPDQKLVVLRQDVYDGLFFGDVFSRSTVVHELAHIVLNHAVTLNRSAPTSQHSFCEDSEWQAKALTAAIMMPIEACRAAHSADELAKICGTSTQAARYRLDKLTERGVIDPDRYKGTLFGC